LSESGRLSYHDSAVLGLDFSDSDGLVLERQLEGGAFEEVKCCGEFEEVGESVLL